MCIRDRSWGKLRPMVGFGATDDDDLLQICSEPECIWVFWNCWCTWVGHSIAVPVASSSPEQLIRPETKVPLILHRQTTLHFSGPLTIVSYVKPFSWRNHYQTWIPLFKAYTANTVWRSCPRRGLSPVSRVWGVRPGYTSWCMPVSYTHLDVYKRQRQHQ